MNELFKVMLSTNEDSLIAYVDLAGTKALYLNDLIPVKRKGKIIYNGLLRTFLVTFKNSFTDEEISEHFYINIYGDSILIALRKKDKHAANKLLKFLMTLQRDLAFGSETNGISIPCRAILARGEFFSIHIAETSEEMFNPKFTSVAICGGKGMVNLDRKLKGLPVGVYVHSDIMPKIKSSTYHDSIKVKKENLHFIKQPVDYINHALSFEDMRRSLTTGIMRPVTLRDVIKKGLIEGGISKPFSRKAVREKWYPWIEAHTKGLKSIERLKKENVRQV